MFFYGRSKKIFFLLPTCCFNRCCYNRFRSGMFIKGTCQLGLDPLSFLFPSDEKSSLSGTLSPRLNSIHLKFWFKPDSDSSQYSESNRKFHNCFLWNFPKKFQTLNTFLHTLSSVNTYINEYIDSSIRCICSTGAQSDQLSIIGFLSSTW
jgi:hypothetical protein